MHRNILSETEGEGTLESRKLDLRMKGTWSMQHLLDLRSAPRFKFYFLIGNKTAKMKLFQEAETTSDFCMVNGKTNDGRIVRTEEIVVENVNVNSEGESSIEFKARSVILGAEETVDEIRFLIPNLEFVGTEMSTYENGGRQRIRLDKFTIDLESYELQLRQVRDYKEIISGLKRTYKGIAITAIAIVRSTSSQSSLVTQEVMSLMDVINELLNLAMGRFVYWPKCEGYRKDRLMWERLRGDILLNPFGSRLGFVDFRKEPRALSEFISSSFTSFKKWITNNGQNGRTILYSYVWGLNLPILETGIYSLSYALEGLVNRFLDEEEYSYFSPKIYEKQKYMIKEFMKTQVISQIVEKEKAKEFIEKLDGKIKGLLQRPFKDRIKALLEQCENINYKDEWIRSFVNVRNKVIHHLREKDSKALSSAWFKGLELIELIFLGKKWCSTHYHQSKITDFGV